MGGFFERRGLGEGSLSRGLLPSLWLFVRPILNQSIAWQSGTETSLIPHLVSEKPAKNGDDGSSDFLGHRVEKEARGQQHHFPQTREESQTNQETFDSRRLNVIGIPERIDLRSRQFPEWRHDGIGIVLRVVLRQHFPDSFPIFERFDFLRNDQVAEDEKETVTRDVETQPHATTIATSQFVH